MPLVPQQFAIPLAFGLNQKADPRALEVPAMTICTDAQFDEIGGVQTRYPYASIGSEIFGGGTLADVRQVVANGNELLCFTETELYSWNAQLEQWVLKGEHLAVKTTEEPKFVTTGDQVDCDRAELNGTVFYAWTAGVLGYVAAMDKVTGSVLMAPTAITGTPEASRLRLTALATKVLLTFHDNVAGTYGYAMDPAAPALTIMATLAPTGGGYYDIVKQPGADKAVFAARLAPTTSYSIGTVDTAPTVTTSTKVRVCSGSIAVSCEPTGTSVQVIRSDGTGIRGDLITIAGLVDVYTAQVVGTADYSPTNQIAAAHRSTVDGAGYRCYAFWTSGETTDGNLYDTKTNWVDTTNVLGTQSIMIAQLGVASRAFDHDGRVYVNLVFAGETVVGGELGLRAQLQNTYFLYRDDAFLVAKQAFGRAGGFSYSTCHLPSVQALGAGVFSWCGIARRVISIGTDHFGYAARAPLDITLKFDSNEARRCVRLGQTLYIACGEGLLQYDGASLTECGFHVYPWYISLVTAASGNLEDGTYTYKCTTRWDNARGDRDRSTTATALAITVSGGPRKVQIGNMPLRVTHKDGVVIEYWRTLKDPNDDSPFYLVTSQDPSDTSNPNRHLENPSSTLLGFVDGFNDEFADATAATKESNPENGSVLELLAPPAATIITATSERIFLAGIAGDPDRVWYSRLRGDNEVASFHDALTITIPREGGDITALAFINETLVVFRETAVYALTGDGFDNLGGGSNYGPARALSIDVGAVNHESVALFDKGLIFKSSKGWYLLNKGWSCDYIGGPVSDYDDETVVAVHVMEAQHQIRCITTERMLVLDTLVNQWGEWTIAGALHAAIWRGTYHYLAPSIAAHLVLGDIVPEVPAGVYAELTTYAGVNYGMDLETAWIPMGQVQGYGRVWKALILGEYRSTFALRVRLARNYLTTYFQDKRWTVSPVTVGGPLQIEHRPSIQEMQAIKIRITAEGPSVSGSVPSGEALKLTSLGLELGVERGLFRLPAAQRQ
jgi:hypothetical protein